MVMVSEATARVGDDDASKKFSTLAVVVKVKRRYANESSQKISVRRFLTPFLILY